MSRVPAPAEPRQQDFTDKDGYVDYEEFDHAWDQFVMSSEYWHDKYGKKYEQEDRMWEERHRELYFPA